MSGRSDPVDESFWKAFKKDPAMVEKSGCCSYILISGPKCTLDYLCYTGGVEVYWLPFAFWLSAEQSQMLDLIQFSLFRPIKTHGKLTSLHVYPIKSLYPMKSCWSAFFGEPNQKHWLSVERFRVQRGDDAVQTK